MATETINFDENWNNKLDNKYFTSLRAAQTFVRYKDLIGNKFNVSIDNTPYCKAKLMYVREGNLYNLPRELTILDTGLMNPHPLLKKYGIVDICVILLFERLK